MDKGTGECSSILFQPSSRSRQSVFRRSRFARIPVGCDRLNNGSPTVPTSGSPEPVTRLSYTVKGTLQMWLNREVIPDYPGGPTVVTRVLKHWKREQKFSSEQRM